MTLDDATLDPYRLRTVRVAIQTTFMVLVGLLLFRVLPGGDQISTTTFVTMWGLAAAGTAFAFYLPWQKLIESGAALRVLYAWSFSDIVLITIAVAIVGRNSSSFFMLYMLTTIFFAMSYPLRSQIALFVFTSVCYLTAAAIADLPAPIAHHFLRLVVLGIVAFMASFMSRELIRQLIDRNNNQKALVQTNSLLHATLESTADGILVVNRDGEIVAFNERFVNMWRIPEDVISSRDDERAIEAVLDQLRDPAAFLEKVQSLYDSPTDSSSDVLEFKDGRVIERYSHPQWVAGEVVGRVWSFRDVTEQHFSHSKIRDTLDALKRADGERRRLLTHLVKAKEEERARVAADIHDDSVQIMTSIAIEMERLARKAADPEMKEKLTLLEESVRAAIGSLRSMVFELKPPTLTQDGLVSALSLYLEEFQLDTGVRYELNNELDDEPSQELRVVLYRIAQEALVNIRKHARASHVRVDLVPEDSGIRLRITDDGVGFDLGSSGGSVSRGHIGMTEMRERAEMVGGNLAIRAAEPAGTVVETWVPTTAAALVPDAGERASA